jgi:hypothetical protein
LLLTLLLNRNKEEERKKKKEGEDERAKIRSKTNKQEGKGTERIDKQTNKRDAILLITWWLEVALADLTCFWAHCVGIFTSAAFSSGDRSASFLRRISSGCSWAWANEKSLTEEEQSVVEEEEEEEEEEDEEEGLDE